jgi:hypothetical protein
VLAQFARGLDRRPPRLRRVAPQVGDDGLDTLVTLAFFVRLALLLGGRCFLLPPYLDLGQYVGGAGR